MTIGLQPAVDMAALLRLAEWLRDRTCKYFPSNGHLLGTRNFPSQEMPMSKVVHIQRPLFGPWLDWKQLPIPSVSRHSMC